MDQRTYFSEPRSTNHRVGCPVTSATELGEGTPMYVMSKEDGRWQLTANQNTAVAIDS